MTFVTASGQDGAGPPWGAGGGGAGERHVHRRRSACDWAAFLWGLAGTQAGAGRGKGWGGGDGRGWLWRPEEEEMTVCVLPLPRAANSCRSGGPGGTLVAGGAALVEEVWRPVLFSARLLAQHP